MDRLHLGWGERRGRRLPSRRRLGGRLDVPGLDAALRPAAGHRGKVDVALTRQPPCQRRGTQTL